MSLKSLLMDSLSSSFLFPLVFLLNSPREESFFCTLRNQEKIINILSLKQTTCITDDIFIGVFSQNSNVKKIIKWKNLVGAPVPEA